MKVWIHSAFDNLPCEGFRKQRFWLMAEAFVRAGHEVTYWTGDFNHGTKSKRIFSADPGMPGITVKILPVTAYAKNVSLKRVASHLRYAAEWMKAGTEEARRQRPDLIIAACPTIGVAAAALRIAREFSAVSAVDIMDAWPETFERLAPKPLRIAVRAALWPLKRRIRRVYRGSDIVSGVSERYAGLTGRGDYRLAYHGVENALALAPWPGRANDSADAEIRLAYVGNLGNGYDLGTVFGGMEELRKRGMEVSLTVAGRGPMEETYRSTAPAGVRFAGYLAEPELEKLLAGSDIGVVPLGDESWVGLP